MFNVNAHHRRQQDDSALNRKIIRRILEGEAKTFSNAVIEEADDGTSAVSAVQSALEAGLSFDFIFMDFVMVSKLVRKLDRSACPPLLVCLFPFALSLSALHNRLFQLKMNGPEAVKILRNSLKFRYNIIGTMLLRASCSHVHSVLMMIILGAPVVLLLQVSRAMHCRLTWHCSRRVGWTKCCSSRSTKPHSSRNC